MAKGDASIETGLSIHHLGNLIRDYIADEASRNEKYRNFGLPEVHSPDQAEGSIAGIPLFPNAANRPRILIDQIRQVETRLSRLEGGIENRFRSVSESLANVETKLEELGSSALRVREGSPGMTATERSEEAPTWRDAPARLRVNVEHWRKATIVGAGWLVIAICMCLVALLGPLTAFRVISLRFPYNPVAWCVTLLAIFSVWVLWKSDEKAMEVPEEWQKWVIYTSVSNAASTHIRPLLGSVFVSSTYFLFASIVYILSSVALLVMRFSTPR